MEGNIPKAIMGFAIPLLIGNLFQQLYNTVDSYVVGNFVGTSALAAVGASGSIINMLVGFFMGLSAGAGVVISQYFGGGRDKDMSDAVHSAIALTAFLGVAFTILGIAFTRPLLHLIGVPEDVLPHSTLYLSLIHIFAFPNPLHFLKGSKIPTSNFKMGLIFKTEASAAAAGLMRPPFFKCSRV